MSRPRRTPPGSSPTRKNPVLFAITLAVTGALTVGALGCSSDESDNTDTAAECEPATDSPRWQVLASCREHQLLGVWSGPTDTWIVGANGQALRFDGCAWETLAPGTSADLWWVFGVDGTIFIGGADGTLLRWRDGSFDTIDTGTTATLFGIWGPTADDVWAVGFEPNVPDSGVVLRFDGNTVAPVSLPSADAEPFKVTGTSSGEVVIVGRNDLVLRRTNPNTPLTPETTGLGADWVTVATVGDRTVAVGGPNGGQIAEYSNAWSDASPDGIAALQGICGESNGSAVATGMSGSILRRDTAGAWQTDDNAPLLLFQPGQSPVEGCQQPIPDYHACSVAPDGGVFVVGGNFLKLTEGAVLYFGPTLPPIPTSAP